MAVADICAELMASSVIGRVCFLRFGALAGAVGGQPAQDVADRFGLSQSQGALAGPVDDDPLFVDGLDLVPAVRYGRPVPGQWTLRGGRLVKS